MKRLPIAIRISLVVTFVLCGILLLAPTYARADSNGPGLGGLHTLYVGAFGNFAKRSDCRILVKSGDQFVEANDLIELYNEDDDPNLCVAVPLKEGTTTLYLLDAQDNVVESQEVAIYDLEAYEWEIESAANSSYVLDVQKKSKSNGAQLITYQRNGGANQHFRFKNNPDVSQWSFTIRCVLSGKYLDVKRASTAKSAPVIQYTYNGNDNQCWTLYVDENNLIEFVSDNSTLLLDAQGGKVRNGCRIIQYSWNGGNNQKWKLKRL